MRKSSERVRKRRIFAAVGIASLAASGAYADGRSPVGATAGSSGDTYYFSSSAGDDNNSCKEAKSPCASIARLNSLAYKGGDTIALLAGDTWTLTNESLNLLGPNTGLGRQNVFTDGSRILTVTTYGQGMCAPVLGSTSGCAKLKLDPNYTKKVGILLANLSNVVLEKVALAGETPAALEFQSTNGIYIRNNNGANSNVTVRNVQVSDFADLIYVTRIGGSLSKVSILNNHLLGSSPKQTVDNGIWMRFGVTDGLIEGNLIENIGAHDSSAKGFYRGGTGNGILIADGASDIVDQFNITRVVGANYNACGGPVGNWTYDSKNITIQFNESYQIEPLPYRGGCDWAGFDLDGGVSHSVVQYNYSHDNFGPGFGNFISNVGSHKWEFNTVRYNISENDNAKGNLATGSVYIGGSTNLATHSAIYNNTISSNWDGFAGGYCLDIGNDNDLIFANNICYNNGPLGKAKLLNSQVDASGMTLLNNDYQRLRGGGGNPIWVWKGVGFGTLTAFQAATGKDSGSVTKEPGLKAPESGGVCYASGFSTKLRSCPAGYALMPGSALIGSGSDLMKSPYSLDVGTRDYYGDAIPHTIGTGYNIGAAGSGGEHSR